ncbi:hypothetical protein Tsubulata_047762, partial [Turnera subulata]
MAWRHCWYKDVLPFTALIAVECSIVGLNILIKAASYKGLSNYVFSLYSSAIASLGLLPLLFIFRSTSQLPASKFPFCARVFFLALLLTVAQLSGYKAVEYSSPTLASAMNNLLPAFTFTLAVIFRMERLAIKSCSTQAKIAGTLVSISGALVVVLYKGPVILSMMSSTSPSILLHHQLLGSPSPNWVMGGLLFAVMELLYSTAFIILAQVMKVYPAEIVVIFLCNLIGAIICIPICLVAEPDMKAWKLGSDMSLVAVLYSGFFYSCFVLGIRSWAVRLKGPVYIAMFRPLSIAIAAFMSFIFLGDPLHLGSVIGAIIITIGFYAVLWGKAKEEETTKEEPTGLDSLASDSHSKM